jgi:hypothetical protein
VRPFLKTDASIRIKRTWLIIAAGLVFPLGFLPPVQRLLWEHSMGPALPLVPYVLSLGGIYLWNRWWAERRGHCRADERGLWLDDRLLLSREKIQQGYVFEQGERTVVRLGRSFRFLQIEVDNEQEGLALLAAMRLDPGRSVAQYTASHGTRRGSLLRGALFLGMAVVGLGLLMHFARVWSRFSVRVVMMGILFAIVFFAINSGVRVAIGADGVRLRRLLKRSRFVPFSAIRSIESDGRDIRILLRDGEAICFHFPAAKGWQPLLHKEQAEHSVALVARIRERLGQAPGERPTLALARAGRPVGEWLRAITARGEAPFRAQEIPDDELWAIVEDTSSTATARAGAAVVLRERLDDEGRARLRVAADACALPPLGQALRVVASEADEESLEGSLEALQDATPRRAAG